MEFVGVVNSLISRAKDLNKTICLPEATDIRVLKAAEYISKNKISKIILVGNKEEILNIANENNISLDNYNIQICNIDEKTAEFKKYSEAFYELRKHKGITMDEAVNTIKDSVYYSMMMVKLGVADGLVSGAIHSTSDTLRPALQVIKQKEGIKNVSSFFLMDVPHNEVLTEKTYIFSDCGLIEFPTEEQLIDITKSSANSYRQLVKKEPKVALLSYSTLGSAKSDATIKTRNVVDELKSMNLDFDVDGELQLDAAIIPSVASSKAKESSVAGYANVLIFPNLEAGNIGYKLVQRFANATALGPITQGLAKPVNDLSRGCSAEDIVGAVAITCIQAEY